MRRPASTLAILVGAALATLPIASLPAASPAPGDAGRLAPPAAVSPLVAALRVPVPLTTTPQAPPLTQSWTTTTLITANDDWSGVPGIVGYLGQDMTVTTGTNPQTLLGVSAISPDVDVIANQASASATSGGVAEIDGIADPTIALQGSGTADAPHVIVYLSTTGYVGLNISYNLRDVDGTADNSVQPVALQYRVGSTGNFTNIPAGFVADASSGPNLATLVTPVSVPLPPACDNQAEVQVRIITANAVGSDEWIGIDDISVTGTAAGNILTISDATVTEGSSGTVTATFTVSLTDPAGVGGVTFDIATADGTGASGATTADGDYVGQSLTGQSIAEAGQTYTFDVTVNGDTAPEASETFRVDVTNVVGATVSDGQGVGTITNDDNFPIPTIQGSGSSSPYAGLGIMTSGIVTGVSGSGFFIQDAAGDGDPSTSDGVLVYTNSLPPASAAVGNMVSVTGNVQEYIPSSDPNSPPLTEIVSPTVVLVSSGNPLPAPIVLTAADTSTTGSIEQLEKYEGMRVSVPSMTTCGPTRGTVNEVTATGTSLGQFYGVVTGVARPFREAGVQANDPLPVANAPRFDANPERLRVNSLGLSGRVAIDVTAGATVTGIVGPLDYGFRTYTIDVDPSTVTPEPVVTGMASAQAIPAPGPGEFTVATYNIYHFYNSTYDGANDTVLNAAAYANRLTKASLLIRNVLRMPDVLALQEVEGLTTLQNLRDRVNADAGSIVYEAAWIAGNDAFRIATGFLYKVSPRLTGVTVTMVGLAEQFTYNSSTYWKFDHPPLVLRGTANLDDGSTYPFTVVANHMKAIGGVATDGFVQEKRVQQADWLASYVNGIQATENVLLVGDLNAYEFNDGFVDVIGTLTGNPAPADQVLRPSPDVVDPNLTVLTVSGGSKYSYTFDGNAHYFDHVIVNAAVLPLVSRTVNAHSNADFPGSWYGDPTGPERLSDHDPSVVYIKPATGKFYTLTPCRVLDTRDPDGAHGGPALAPGNDRVIAFASQCGIPIDAAALSLNVTVVAPTADGYLTLHPSDSAAPLASTINYRIGQVRANNAVVQVSKDGTASGSIFNGSLGTTHVVVDVNGYFY